MRRRILIGAALGVLGLQAAVAQAAVTVLAPGATVAGQTTAQYTAAWWQWALGFAAPNDPFDDPTGALANANQSGPVFFLAANNSGTAARTFTVPGGKYLLLPLLVGETSQLELASATDPTPSEAEVRQTAVSQADHFDALHATLDGAAVPDLFTHRETSPDFSFTSVDNNPIGDPAGQSGIAVADGYWLMLAPLSAGPHTLTFGGSSTFYGFGEDATDVVTPVPEPATVATIVAAMITLTARRRTRR